MGDQNPDRSNEQARVNNFYEKVISKPENISPSPLPDRGGEGNKTMNRHRIHRDRSGRRNRRQSVLELLETVLGRDRQDDPTVEYEKLRRVRIALFGCAPK